MEKPDAAEGPHLLLPDEITGLALISRDLSYLVGQNNAAPDANHPAQMEFTGERFVPELRGQIAYEHRHRYALCLEFARDRDVLDIACGEGYGASLLAAGARTVVAVDIDPASVRHAAARYPASNLDFRVGSATAIPLAEQSVDLIVSFETIEHLAEQREMLGEFTRVLRPDGRLIISSPNKLVYSDRRGYKNDFHVRELYFNEFRAILGEFFPKVVFFGQRLFGASAIHPLVAGGDATVWLDAQGQPSRGMPPLPDPEYFVALCGKDANDGLDYASSIYVDVSDDLLTDIRSPGLTISANSTNGSANGSPDAAHLSTNGDGNALRKIQEKLMLVREDFDARLQTSESERARLQRELDGERERAAGFERERAAFEERLHAAREHIANVERERANVDERIAVVEAECAALRSDRATTIADLAKARAATAEQSDASARSAARAAEELARFRAASEAAESRLRDLDERRAHLEKQLRAAVSERQEAFVSFDRSLRAVKSERDEAVAAVERSLRTAKSERDEALAAVERARTDLKAARVRIAVIEVELRDARAVAAAAAATSDEDRLHIEALEREKAAVDERLEVTTLVLREAEETLERTTAELANERDAALSHRTAAVRHEAHIRHLLAVLARTERFSRTLGAGQHRAADTIAALELERMRLQFELATKVRALEAKAAGGLRAARHSRQHVALLSATLALRERRIAVLESVIRDAAEEMIRNAQADAERYLAMVARFRASKFWKLRTVARNALSRFR